MFDYFNKIARSISGKVAVVPIVEAAIFGVPSTLIAGFARLSLIVVLRSTRYKTDGPEALATVARA
ncbi:hypothetical protein D3C71_2244620 [compost metagenome]